MKTNRIRYNHSGVSYFMYNKLHGKLRDRCISQIDYKLDKKLGGVLGPFSESYLAAGRTLDYFLNNEKFEN